MTPWRPKRLPGDEYTWESQLPVVNTRGVLTPSGEYVGDSWLPVVDFLVYFEQASKQVLKDLEIRSLLKLSQFSFTVLTLVLLNNIIPNYLKSWRDY